MSKIVIDTAVNSTGFKAGLDSMRQEASRFKQTFTQGMNEGKGFFGSLDKSIGKLATGPLGGLIASIGAGMLIAGKAVDMVARHFDVLTGNLARAKNEMQGYADLNKKVAAQQYQGSSANQILQSDVEEKALKAKQDTEQENRYGDPTTLAGAIKNYRARGMGAIAAAAQGMRTFLDTDGSQAEELAFYNEKKDTASKSRLAAAEARRLFKFQEFDNKMVQYNAEQGYQGKLDQALVKGGYLTDFDAQEQNIYRAKSRYAATQKMYGDTDPRTIAARGEIVDSVSSYTQLVAESGRYRNDPVIAADSLARLGGGGGVNAFGDGRGELLSETKRIASGIERVVTAIKDLKLGYTPATTDIN